MSDHFTSHYLAEILRDIFLEERSGLLRLDAASGPRCELRFVRGMLAGGDSPSGATTLAAALRDDGLASAEVLLEAVPDCSNAADLCAALLARGALNREALGPGMKGFVRRALAEAFSWTGGMFEFVERTDEEAFFAPDVLFTFESILGGVGSMSNFEPLREVLMALPGRLRLNPNQFLPVHRLALKPYHGFVLSRIDGSLTMAEISQVVPADAIEESLKFAYGLVAFGVVIFDPPLGRGPFRLRELIPAHHESRARAQREESLIRDTLQKMSGQTPAEILGIAAGTDAETLRAAYEDRKARYRRERFSDGVREALKREIDLIEARFTEAFFSLELGALETAQRSVREGGGVQTVSEDDLNKRREFSKTEAQAAQEQNIRLSEKYHVQARDYFREGDFYNCIQFCRLAIKFNAEAASSFQLMAEALSKNPDRRWQRQAEEAFLKATELDPFNAEFFATLGLFYRDRGMDLRARKMFEKALEILPSHPVASKELKLLKR